MGREHSKVSIEVHLFVKQTSVTVNHSAGRDLGILEIGTAAGIAS